MCVSTAVITGVCKQCNLNSKSKWAAHLKGKAPLGAEVSEEEKTSVHLSTRAFFCFLYLDQILTVMDCPRHTLCSRALSFKMEFTYLLQPLMIHHSACSTPRAALVSLPTFSAPPGLRAVRGKGFLLQARCSLRSAEPSRIAPQGTDVRANPFITQTLSGGSCLSNGPSSRAVHSMSGDCVPGTVLVAENTTQEAHVAAGRLENWFFSFNQHLSL